MPSVDPKALHAIEVVLRDSRNMTVIMALARLGMMPTTQDGLQATIRDMRVVQDFIATRIPDALKAAATTLFTAHGKAVRDAFLGDGAGAGRERA